MASCALARRPALPRNGPHVTSHRPDHPVPPRATLAVTGFERSVSSTLGPGIASDQLDRIFERFWQVSRSDRRGPGLGLFIAKSIVDAHRCTIAVKSRPGAGCTFSVKVPAA